MCLFAWRADTAASELKSALPRVLFSARADSPHCVPAATAFLVVRATTPYIDNILGNIQRGYLTALPLPLPPVDLKCMCYLLLPHDIEMGGGGGALQCAIIPAVLSMIEGERGGGGGGGVNDKRDHPRLGAR